MQCTGSYLALATQVVGRRYPASGVGALQRDDKAVEGGGAAEHVEMHVTRHVVDARACVLACDAKAGSASPRGRLHRVPQSAV
jgi:hypothetical protein